MQKKNKITQFILWIFFLILCLMILFPFCLLVSASFTDSATLAAKGYKLIPEHFDLSAYKFVFRNTDQILNAYKVTAIYSLINMVLNVLLMAMIAYPLATDKLKGKKFINFYLYFTMLFSGGLVPTYIVVAKYLHLNNTIWVYILPQLISPWYVFMMRTFFGGIQKEIMESATIDGASEYRIFFRMILPLSKPVLATVALFVFLASWNDWNTALIYITDEKLFSLQYLLQSIMENINMIKQNQVAASMTSMKDIPTETVRMAMAVIVAGPALIVFPFFQKYFTKGLTVGAVKG